MIAYKTEARPAPTGRKMVFEIVLSLISHYEPKDALSPEIKFHV